MIFFIFSKEFKLTKQLTNYHILMEFVTQRESIIYKDFVRYRPLFRKMLNYQHRQHTERDYYWCTITLWSNKLKS